VDTAEILHIISRIRSGDTDAFRVLVRQYKEMVFGLALKMTRQREDAEEIAQDTFLKAFKGIQRFKGQSKFSTWLYQIGYFTAINHLRKKKLQVIEIDDIPVADESESVLEKLNNDDQKIMIDKALGLLKPDERALVTFFYLDEMSMEEIAKITELTLSNVKVKIHRSRKKLHDVLVCLMKKN